MSDTHTTNRFEYGAKIILYVLAAFLPLAFIPYPIGVEFGREALFTILVALAAILWLLSVLTKGELRFSYSALPLAAFLFLLVSGVATVLSKAPALSFSLADATAEKYTTLLLGVVLMCLLAGVFRSREDAGVFAVVLLAAGAVSALATAIQLLFKIPLFTYLNIPNAGIDFNVVGTLNALALFYLVLFLVALAFVVSPGFMKWNRWFRAFLAVSALLLLLNLFLIHFRTAWIVLLGSMVVLFALQFLRARMHGASLEKAFDWRYWTILGLLVVSVVMLLVNRPILPRDVPIEAHPSLSATWNITLASFKEGVLRVLFGTGPGTFGLDWSLYRDPSINQSVFWNLRFNQGFSWLATVLATSGVLGLISLLAFLGIAAFLFLTAMIHRFDEGAGATASPQAGSGELAHGLLLAFLGLLFASFIYPANFSLLLLFFAASGLLLVVLGRPAGDAMPDWLPDLWAIRTHTIRFLSPWAVFLSSLMVVFLLAIGVVVLYSETGILRVAFAQEAGVRLLNEGKIDEAIAQFERAADVSPNNFLVRNNLAQVRGQKIRTLIQRASAGENVQQEFQQAVSDAIGDARRATELYPVEAVLWRNLGGLYELILPFIPGAERFAFASYQKAAELDPKNPLVYVEWGRAGLTYADALLLRANQGAPAERENLIQNRTRILNDVALTLQKAAAAKPDLAQAHFMLAQTAIRLGDVKAAIAATENAKLAAPFDIGVAFQLGLLYYQTNDLDRAQAEFVRAVSLNENYSNARYFLGLIYDRKGVKDRSIEEFVKIEALNPDNQEVKKILTNLRSGRGALDGIVPPAPPPERRAETPVRETR